MSLFLQLFLYLSERYLGQPRFRNRLSVTSGVPRVCLWLSHRWDQLFGINMAFLHPVRHKEIRACIKAWPEFKHVFQNDRQSNIEPLQLWLISVWSILVHRWFGARGCPVRRCHSSCLKLVLVKNKRLLRHRCSRRSSLFIHWTGTLKYPPKYLCVCFKLLTGGLKSPATNTISGCLVFLWSSESFL